MRPLHPTCTPPPSHTNNAALESPDDLVCLFGILADGVITSATSAPAGAGEEQGADANSAAGLYLRTAYARYTAMPFEVRCRLVLLLSASSVGLLLADGRC